MNITHTPIIRERTSKIHLQNHLQYAHGWTMRVWREEPLASTRTFEPNRVVIDEDIRIELGKHIQMPSSPLDIAKAVLALERVNAVEVTDLTGHGECLYKDWP